MPDTVILEKSPLTTGSGAGYAASTRKRLYIFPTQHGLVYACMLPVMLLGAINYTNNMAYMLSFMLGSLFMICMVHTYRNLRGLVIASNDARSVFAGEVAEFPLVFDNRNGPLRTGICVDVRPRGWKFRRSATKGIEHVRLEPGQIHRDSLPVQTRTRGWLNPGRLRIHSSWPLGLFRAWSYIDSKSTCIVYPKPHGDPGLPYLTEDTSLDQRGDQPGTDDFTGFRHYRPGDSIRNIDWKVLAREQGLLVKKFSGSGARQLILHWDQTVQLGDTEARLSQLALWVVRAEQEGYRYGLVIPGSQIDIDNGENQQHLCLRTLATYATDDSNQV